MHAVIWSFFSSFSFMYHTKGSSIYRIRRWGGSSVLEVGIVRNNCNVFFGFYFFSTSFFEDLEWLFFYGVVSFFDC
nr:hypothetical protein [uncultured bacterium]